ncbi:NAD-dependent epimerase/dehydratase family protein [Aeromonas jandaei]
MVGGCGYVGGHLIDLLKRKERFWDVTVYDNLMYETRYLKKVNFIYGDVRDQKHLGSIINCFDIIVWLAAIVGDGACQVDVQLTEEVNNKAIKWLVDNFEGKIIFTSTCSVYGINNELLDENAATNPLSIYASTKLEVEKYICENAKNYLIFRLGTLYGQGDSYSRIRLDLVVNVLTKKASEGEPMTVFGGEQWRPLLHVKDAANAIIYSLENDLNGLFNLSTGNYRISQVAEKIHAVLPDSVVVNQDISFEDSRNYKVDNRKITSTGWVGEYSLEDGILEMVSIFKDQRVLDINDSSYSNVAHLKKMYSLQTENDFY